MCSAFNLACTAEDNFRNSGLMDSEGNIKENSKLILVVTNEGALTAEGGLSPPYAAGLIFFAPPGLFDDTAN